MRIWFIIGTVSALECVGVTLNGVWQSIIQNNDETYNQIAAVLLVISIASFAVGGAIKVTR